MTDSSTGKWVQWDGAGTYSLSQQLSEDIEIWHYAWDEDLIAEDSEYFETEEEAETAGFKIIGRNYSQ